MKPIISREKLLELLPHGSGIDSEWDIIIHKNGNVTAKNWYHAMNEDGYYDGQMPFTVRIFRVKKSKLNKLTGPCEGQYQIVSKKGDIDFTLSCNENRKVSFYGLKDYLNETLQYSIESILTPLRSETINENEIEQWLKNI